MKKNLLYIVPESFTGWANSVIRPDGRVEYSDLYIGEYLARNPGVRIITEQEFDSLLEAHVNAMVTAPQRITQARFDEMMSILPPARYGRTRGVEHFHCPERTYGPIVSWFARIGLHYLEWNDFYNIPLEDVARKAAHGAGLF